MSKATAPLWASRPRGPQKRRANQPPDYSTLPEAEPEATGPPRDHSVITNLLAIMVASIEAARSGPNHKEPSNLDLMNTLKSIQKQLKTTSDS